MKYNLKLLGIAILSLATFAFANAQDINRNMYWGGGGNWGGWDNDTAPNNCRVWYDGCNTCSRQYPGGPLVCTKLACFAHSQPYCKDYFQSSNNYNPWFYPWGWNPYSWNTWGNNNYWRPWNTWNSWNNWHWRH